MTIHAHIETYSTDCDGALSSGYILTPNPAELADEAFGDIRFHNRVVTNIVNTYSIDNNATLRVTRVSGNEVQLMWNEPTEEGGRAAEALICTDERCDLEEQPWRRDHQAEAAGY